MEVLLEHRLTKIKKINIKTLLPVIESNNKMNFVEWRFLDPLKVNKFGILEKKSFINKDKINKIK